MVYDLLKAFLIGICASAPIGPVVIYVMQITLTRNLRAGFATGIGSAVIDTLYAALALFAVAMVQDIIIAHQALIMLLGGLLIIYVGAGMFFKDPMRNAGKPISASSYFGYAIQSAGCALANPGALAFMIALVAIFAVDMGETKAPVWMMVLMVFSGALTFWFCFSWYINKLRKKIDKSLIYKLSKVTGCVVMVIGVVLVARGIILFLR